MTVMNMTSVFKPSGSGAPDKRHLLFSNAWCFLAFGGGAGLTPKAPGTAGTLLAFPLYYVAVVILPLFGLVVLAAAMLAAGALICSRANEALQHHDDGAIVWDEISAFFAVLVIIPADWGWQLAAFTLFRLLDAAKPFPINRIDRHVGGGWGVMADDIAAAAITAAVIVGVAAAV